MVHEDEWTVEQAALAPQERNRVGSKESFRQFAAIDVRAEPAAMGQADGTGLVAVNQSHRVSGCAEP